MKNRIFTNTTASRIHDWPNQLLNGWVRIPNFQRDYCWSDENISLFIDSIVKGWPLGNVFLVQNQGVLEQVEVKDKFTSAPVQNVRFGLVLDGAQRLETLFKLFVSEEISWLYNMEADQHSHAGFDDAQKMCEDNPFIFNVSRYLGCLHRDGLEWKEFARQEDRDRLKDVTDTFSSYRLNFLDRLIRHILPEEKDLLDQVACMPSSPSAPKKMPSKREALKTMSESEYKTLSKDHAKAEWKWVEDMAAYNKTYDPLLQRIAALRTKYLPNFISKIDEIEQLDLAYLGTTDLITNMVDRSNVVPLAEMIEYFKRINMAGVPVELDYLEELSKHDHG